MENRSIASSTVELWTAWKLLPVNAVIGATSIQGEEMKYCPQVLTTYSCPVFVGKIAVSPGAVAVVESATDLLTSGSLGCQTACL